MDRQLAIDLAFRWSLLAAAVVAFLGSELAAGLSLGVAFQAALLAVLILWVLTSLRNARTLAAFPAIDARLAHDPDAAQTELRRLLARAPLAPTTRIHLYHRLAAAQHHAGRFHHAGLLAAGLLSRPLAGAQAIRPDLLILLAECRLRLGDLHAAYPALLALASSPLTLHQRMQRLALQTHYELACGYDHAALVRLADKLALAELMPPRHSATVHALFALAARRARREDLEPFLTDRARLLCTPDQLQSVLPEAAAAPPSARG